MKTALSVTGNRLAPLFDVSRHLLVVEWRDGKESARAECCPAATAWAVLAELKRLGVAQLVCGAISRPMQQAAMAMDIEVFGFLTGESEAVIDALIHGQLDKAELRMPGCRACRRGRRRRCQDAWQPEQPIKETDK